MTPSARQQVERLSRGRRAAFAILPSLVLLVAVGGLELGLRAWAPIDSIEVLVRSRWQQDDFEDRNHVRIFEGDPVLFWRLKPDLHDVVWDFTLVSTNAQGLRWRRTLGPKAAGELRIVCMGDSVTFGYRVPLVWPDAPERYDRSAHPFPELVEARLRAAEPARPIEVVPLAVPGYTSAQGRAWLQRVGSRLGADVVLLQYGWNDVSLRERPDRESMPDGWARRTARTMAIHSQVVLRLVHWWQGHRTATGTAGAPQPRLSQEEYVANLLAMARLARQNGAVPVILGPIYRDAVTDQAAAARVQAYRSTLRAAAARTGVDYLEIPELTERGYPGNAGLFGESIHPNAAGHRLMACTVLGFLASHGLVARDAARCGAVGRP